MRRRQRHSLSRSRSRVCLGVIALGALTPVVLAACVREERRPTATVRDDTTSKSLPPVINQTQYLVADPMNAKGGPVALSLGGPGQHGLVVDKRRVVIGYGEPRVAVETAPEPIVGAQKIPTRLGGGFLFWTANTLYRTDSFDSSLRPLARVPESIETISFAPKALIVRTHNGERWGFNLPKGDRAPIVPIGVADVQALDDGRALGFNDQGAVFTSTDHGAKWTDATAQVKSSPQKVMTVAGDLWLVESNGGASRLEPDGRLAWFDKAPPENPPDLRSKDPRWRGTESPLRTVFHGGASIDDNTAIVIESGDVVRVDVHTGEILSIVPGRLPPDAQCEAVPTNGDVLFACVSRSAGSSAFVVSHTLTSDTPVVEQTLTGGGGFFTSDDGGIVYTASCSGINPSSGGSSPSPQVTSVCVRMPGGRWEERDLSGLSTDGGPGDVSVARWVPRADGRVVAVVVEPSPGIYDPVSQSFQPIAEEAKEVVGRGSPSLSSIVHRGKLRSFRKTSGGGFVDSSWSFGAGSSSLHGWQRHGEAVEISEDGKLTRSPYSLDVVYAGAFGLGRSKDGRLYQSTDHGATWIEVATPPSGIESGDLVSCTTAGCDLGAFYRVGWATRPPRVDPPRTAAPSAPEVRRTRGLELSCRPQGVVTMKTVPRTENSPEDLGLGAVKLPVPNEKVDWAYVRNPVMRTILSPIHDASANDHDDSSTAQAYRAMFSGYSTSRDADIITVTGPNKSAMALRRGFSYVPAFDPSGRIVRTSIGMTDVVAAGRRAGMTTDEILAEDWTETGSVIPLGTLDANASSDVVIHNADHGLVSIVRGERVRVAIRTSQNNATIISAVSLPNDETGFLELDSSGVGHVFKIGVGGALSDLFDVSPTANETYYPANPDALAVGPKGDLAILRTPSGSDPASSLDPAFLIIQAMQPTPLAPWSDLKFADDAACRSDKDGYRAIIQTVGPWVRTTTPELRVDEGPMIARVRWSTKRVCVEGFEVKLPTVSLHVPPTPGSGASGEQATFSTYLVAKGSTFARVGISEGLEWRQSLECTIVSTGP